jgi:hypothetical protein
MEFLEKHLEQIILESDVTKLQERGLYIFDENTKIKSQVNIGNYGIADLILFNRPTRIYRGMIKVVELKKGKLNIDAFLQAVRYLRGIKSYLEKREIEHTYDFNITLIGSEVVQTDFCYLSSVFDDLWGPLNFHHVTTDSYTSIDMYSYKYKIDGIYFKRESYSLLDEGF